MENEKTYNRLIELFDQNGARYRLIEHQSEGRTEIVNQMRGHEVSQAAKCIIIMVKFAKKVSKYILCVVPGNAKVNVKAV